MLDGITTEAPPPTPAPTEVAPQAPVVPTEVPHVEPQTITPKPADIQTTPVAARRSILSKALSAISFGKLGK